MNRSPVISIARLLFVAATLLPVAASAQTKGQTATHPASAPASSLNHADERVERYLKRARDEVRQIQQDSPWVLLHLARAQVRAGDPAAAKETLRQVTEMGADVEKAATRYILWKLVARSHAEIADMAGAKRNWKLALETVPSLEDEQLRDHFRRGLAEDQMEAGNFAEAWATIGRIDDMYAVQEAYAHLALAKAEAGDLAGAQDSATLAGSVPCAMQAWRAIVYGLVAKGDVATARDIVASTDPNDVPYSLPAELTIALAEAGDTAGAQQALGRVGVAGARVEVWLAVAKTESQAGNKIVALDSVDAAIDEASAEMPAEFEAPAERDAEYETPAEGDAEYEASAERGAEYAQIADVLVQIGLPDKAKQILGVAIEEVGSEDADYARYRIALVKIQLADVAGALHVAKKISGEHDGLFNEVVVAAARDWIANQNTAKARRILQQLRTPVDFFNDENYSVIAELARAGEVEGAKAAAAKIGPKHERQEQFRRIAIAEAEAGDVAGAKATADARTGSDRASTYVAIAAVQADAGDKAGARATLRSALAGSPVHERYDIAVAQAKLGEFAVAIETADKLGTADNLARPRAYGDIARIRAEAGDLKGIETWLEQTNSPLLRARILLGAAQGLREQGQPAASQPTE